MISRAPVLAADPDPQPGIIPRAQMLLDRLQPVMPAAAAARPQPELAQRQIRIIHHHQQPRQRPPGNNSTTAPTASPLEFMNVCGSHSSTRRPPRSARASRALNFFS